MIMSSALVKKIHCFYSKKSLFHLSIKFVLEAMSDGTLPILDAAKKFLTSTQSLSSKLPNSALI
jgi:hypothetical protein